MHLRRIRVSLALALVTAAAGRAVVVADEWMAPTPQIFGSTAGAYALKTIPPRPVPQVDLRGGRSQGTLFTLAPDGREAVLWTRELVNLPHRALVTDNGKHVVTLDTWFRVGYEHALVIYGEKGVVVADLPLEALLTREEIAERVPFSTSSRWWLRGATMTFTEANDQLVISLAWGKVLRVALATGTIGA
jgi:hypothetical protein